MSEKSELLLGLDRVQKLHAGSQKSAWLSALALLLVLTAFLYTGHQLNSLAADITAARARRAEAEQGIRDAERTLALLRTELDVVERQIQFARASSDTRAAAETLEVAVGRVQRVQAGVVSADSQLTVTRSASLELPALIEGLFATDSLQRQVHFEVLTSRFRSDPEVVPVLVDYAREHLDNEKGTHNIVNVIGLLDPPVVAPHRERIQELCDQIAQRPDRIKTTNQCRLLLGPSRVGPEEPD